MITKDEILKEVVNILWCIFIGMSLGAIALIVRDVFNSIMENLCK